MILMMRLRKDDKEVYTLLQEMFGEGAWTSKMATGAGIPIKIGSLYALRNAGMITIQQAGSPQLQSWGECR